MKLRYKKDGKRWTWYIEGDDDKYFQTSNDGEGIQEILLNRNERKDLEGTCQFSVRGVSDSWAKRKIRDWMNNNCWYC
jgi:hypothetical protein